MHKHVTIVWFAFLRSRSDMHLTDQSRRSFTAALAQISDEEINRRSGDCTIGTALDLVVSNETGTKLSRISVSPKAVVRFWPLNQSAYGTRATGSKRCFPRRRGALFAEDSSFQLTFEDNRLVFQWLALGPIPTIDQMASV